MQIRHHRLTPATPGTTRELVSLHYGPAGSGPKAFIQASLHADEVPAMLVAQHLRLALSAIEAEGRLTGEVVLVPVANPLGLSQQVLHQAQGRFELASGQNFNRHYADLSVPVAEAVRGRLGDDASANLALVRGALRQACAELPAPDELTSLRRTLLTLAADADTVLDLHCDHDAVLHLYTATPLWHAVEPLARWLGAPLALLATESGDDPFDEACSMFWPRLKARLGAEGDRLPLGCVAVTVELRGESDVRHDLAEQDAQAVLNYLAGRGLMKGERPTPPVQAATAPRPLAGSVPVRAPHGGVLVFLTELGRPVRAGEPVAELIEPIGGASTIVSSPIDGLLYARASRRFVPAGATLLKVAGSQPVRQGRLLSA